MITSRITRTNISKRLSDLHFFKWHLYRVYSPPVRSNSHFPLIFLDRKTFSYSPGLGTKAHFSSLFFLLSPVWSVQDGQMLPASHFHKVFLTSGSDACPQPKLNFLKMSTFWCQDRKKELENDGNFSRHELEIELLKLK